MKLGVISDLHIDRHQTYSSEIYLKYLIEVIEKARVSLIIIAGDISNNSERTLAFINQLDAAITAQVAFVPGNHDIWRNKEDTTTTEAILKRYREHPLCLMHAPIIRGDWCIRWHMGWFDYAYADARFSDEKLQRGKHYGATWQDLVHTDFTEEASVRAMHYADEVNKQLEQYQGKKVILVTHFVTHPAFLVPTPHRVFDFFNGFIGTQSFDALFERYPIRYSIMGHVHFRKVVHEENTSYIAACLGYPREWRTPDLKTELERTIQVIDIEEEA